MAILDNYLIDWNTGVNNAPSDSDNVGSDLAAQIRNIKSVYRTLSFNKMYEDFDFDLNSDPFKFFGSVVFQFKGDITTAAQVGRKVVAQSAQGSSLTGGVIVYCSYNVASNVTLIIVYFWGQEWVDSQVNLFFCTDNSTPESFPMSCVGGTVGIKGAGTTAVVKFDTKQDTSTTFTGSNTSVYTNETKVFMPTKDYRVHLSPSYKDGNASADCSIIKKVVKDYDKFTITLHAAPGTPGGAAQQIFFDWAITMPRYYS